MVYSGVVEGRAKGGVAILISERLSSCLKEWKYKNERLMKVRMRIDGKWVTLIQAYAPTEDSDEGLKDSFYDSLEEMIVRSPKSDQLVVMGDLNVRVGRDVKAWGEVIGRHGEETKNRNGPRLLSACAANELVILNTFFQHKDIHKYTWESRGRGLRTIIDYFVVRKALRVGVADVKVIRGAEVGSDHYLVLMKLKLKIRKQRKPEKSIKQKLRLNKLMEKEVRRKFQRELDIRLRQRACKREEEVENTWQGFRDTIKDVAEKVIGRSRKRRQRRATSWWNEEVKTAVRRKKELYNRALREKNESVWEDYKTASKEAKRVVREAKEEDWLRWGKELQKSFLENRRAFWKKINGKEEGHRLKLGDESKDGTLLTENDEVKNRWKEYFRELFDCEEREIDTRTEAEEREEKVSDEITEDEVRRAIWKIKSGKASGVWVESES